MSEEFDREAEKERLREKYEAEEEARQTTEHMSELLLKGATMTNRHCDECGDPIFRYDGQEFCPTCQKVVQDSRGEADAVGQTSDQPTATAGSGDSQTQDAQRTEGASRESVESAPAEANAAGSERVDAGTTPASPVEGTPSNTAKKTPGSLDDARASLVRTLSTLATEAENATDVRQTHELLSAVREAAEAIAALDRTDR